MKSSQFGPWADEPPTVYHRPRGSAPKQRMRSKRSPEYLHVLPASKRG